MSRLSPLSEEVLKKFINVHGYKYSYYWNTYKNMYTKMNIECSEHGLFTQIPNIHITGAGCNICRLSKRFYSNDEYIDLLNKKYCNKYDYSKTIYTTSRSKIIIICSMHGEFVKVAKRHLSGEGCQKCSIKQMYNDTNYFISKSNLIHNFKYDYSKVEYTTSKSKVIIICKIHGEFKQIVNSHLTGSGCPECSRDNIKKALTSTINQYLNKFHLSHGTKYDYSKVNYINTHTKIEIICKIHGSFHQTPNTHGRGHGCPNCKSSKGEIKILNWLQLNNIKYISQYKIDNCKNINSLPFDFYLEKYNILIEYDGIQHFEPRFDFSKNSKFNFQQTQINDLIKTNYCLNNNIKLLRIPYTDFNNIESVLSQNMDEIIDGFQDSGAIAFVLGSDLKKELCTKVVENYEELNYVLTLEQQEYFNKKIDDGVDGLFGVNPYISTSVVKRQ